MLNRRGQELRELCRGPLDPGACDGAASVVVDWTAAPFLTMAGEPDTESPD